MDEAEEEMDEVVAIESDNDPVLLLLPVPFVVALTLQLILCTIKLRQSRLEPVAVIEGM